MAQTRIYLCSMWAYTEQGTQHVLEALNSLHLPHATYTYVPNKAWFKVICEEKDCIPIQEKFCDIQKSIEQNALTFELGDEVEDFLDSEMMQPHAAHLYRERALIQTDERPLQEPRRSLHPTSTRHTRAWEKLKGGDQSLTFEKMLSRAKLLSIQADTGTTLEWDRRARVVHISAESEAAIDMVQGRLHTIFEDYICPPPRSQHLLLSETNKHFDVDIRLMGEINPELPRSTILDSSSMSLPEQYRRFYRGSASLRICITEEAKYFKRSMFGPRPAGVFDKRQKRWWFTPFSNHVYPSRAPDPSLVDRLVVEVPSVPESLDKNVQEWIDRVPENQSLIVVDQSQIAPSPATTETPSASVSQPPRGVPGGDSPIAIPMRISRRKQLSHSYGNPSIKSTLADATQQQSAELVQTAEPDPQLQPSSGVDLLSDTVIPLGGPNVPSAEKLVPIGEERLDDPLGVYQNITFSMTPLVPVPRIQFQDEASSREYHSTMKQQAPSRGGKKKKAAKLTVYSDLSFETTARDAVMQLLGRMRSKVGKVKLRVEFGRIYLMNLSRDCLATNSPNQMARPWNAEDLVRKLNDMKEKDTLFTKILSTCGNDAEFLAAAKGTGRRPVWAPLRLSVLYQFKCTHLQTGEDFIVEVDGNEFKWKIRPVNDELPPVYVHCLQRQWDFRFVLQHNPTDEVLSRYGEFAKQLVDSVTIPPDTRERAVVLWNEGHGSTATVHHVRVHHSARYQTQDKTTFLDVVQVQNTFVEERIEHGVRQFKATFKPHTKIPNGQVPVWYEASLSSAKAEALFLQNEKLQHGQKTAWTQSTFKQEKILQTLTSRAVEMIKRIDGVGVYCDNGFGEASGAGTGTGSGSSSRVSTALSVPLSRQTWTDEAHYY